MNFLLKIVEGPNKGAEIALVEGVAVTLGKGDDCDVVLADLTMPDVPIKVETSADAVTMDGAVMEPFAVKTLGATSFAIGPADTPWGTLTWPKANVEEDVARNDAAQQDEGTKEPSDGKADEHRDEEGEENRRDAAPQNKERKGERGGCVGCLVALLVLLLILVFLGWFFRAEVRPRAESLWERACLWVQGSGSHPSSPLHPLKVSNLSDIASRYGLSFVESNGVARMSGNLMTRRDRLAATAEVYQAQPGVSLDLSDDESFRTAAEDELFTLSEGALKVAVATNRVLSIVGSSPSPLSLKKVLEALNSDIPKLRNVDVSGVVVSHEVAANQRQEGGAADAGDVPHFTFSSPRRGRKASSSTTMPVCGILTKPYPCLVLRDGRRIMEGAAIGGSVIVEIDADSVVLTNSTGRFTWKP